jgi:gentisate 1,2-dioxygenase
MAKVDMAPKASSWNLDELVSEVKRTLASGDTGDGKLIDGRALAVKASPARGNSTRIVYGLAALPPGFSTRGHSHEAEEIAVVLSGSGSVEIDGVDHPISRNTILLTPSNAGHVTRSAEGDTLVILWFYAPPGSELRWIEPDKHRTDGHAG